MPNSSLANQPAGPANSNVRGAGIPFLSSRLGIIILFLGFNYTLMGTVVYPALPGIQARFHLTAAQLSLIASLPALVSMSLQPVVGWVSDHVDRKVIVGLGLLAYALGGSLVGWVLLSTLTVYLLLLLGRAFTGLGELGAFPHYLAIIHTKLPAEKQQHMLGIMDSLTSLGSVLAPLVGGMLAARSLALPFFATGVFALIALALAWWAIPSLRAPKPTAAKAGPKHRFQFHFSYLGGSLVMGTLVSISTFLGSYAETEFGLNVTQVGLMLAVTPLAMAGGAVLAGRHGKDGYISTRNMVVAGGAGIAGLALIGLARAPWVAAAGLLASGAVLGYWLTAFDHDAMSRGAPELRGLRLSFFQQAKAFGVLLFPFLLGLVIDATGSIRPIYFLLAASHIAIGTVIFSYRARLTSVS